MADEFVTIGKDSVSEFTEKKSVFISSAFVVQTQSEVDAILDEMRVKYYDATHNCFAYVLKDGAVQRFGDDGEPSGTAGMPILNVINKLGICNVLVVVTRYFGGIKLGAGGLVRAYSTAAADVLTSAGKCIYTKGCRLRIEVDYECYAALERMLLQAGCEIEDKSFDRGVLITLKTLIDAEKLCADVVDFCNGGAICEFVEDIYIKNTERQD